MGTSVATPQGPSAVATEGLLTIGELAREAGISTQLVRAWEQRFGFPEPVRLPSGHRRYTDADVRSVRRVVEERDRGLRLEEAIATTLRSGQVGESSSVYAALSRRHPGLASYTLTKRTLLALSWAIEDEAVAQSSSGVLLGTFQRGRYYGQSRRRWEDLARTARATVAMADFEAHDDDVPAGAGGAPARLAAAARVGRGARGARLRGRDGGLRAAGPRRGRRRPPVRGALVRRGPVVRDAAVLTAQAGAVAGSHESARVLAMLEEDRALPSTSPAAATAVFNRMVAYTDGTALRARRP